MLNDVTCQLILFFTLSAGVVEYAKCTSAEELTHNLQTSVLKMTLNCIWWWGSSPGVKNLKEVQK